MWISTDNDKIISECLDRNIKISWDRYNPNKAHIEKTKEVEDILDFIDIEQIYRLHRDNKII